MKPKKLLAILMTMAMLIGMLPTVALANDTPKFELGIEVYKINGNGAEALDESIANQGQKTIKNGAFKTYAEYSLYDPADEANEKLKAGDVIIVAVTYSNLSALNLYGINATMINLGYDYSKLKPTLGKVESAESGTTLLDAGNALKAIIPAGSDGKYNATSTDIDVEGETSRAQLFALSKGADLSEDSVLNDNSDLKYLGLFEFQVAEDYTSGPITLKMQSKSAVTEASQALIKGYSSESFSAEADTTTIYLDELVTDGSFTWPSVTLNPSNEPAATCTITWDLNYDGAETTTSTLEQGATVTTLPDAPTRDGYEFTGWFSAETGGTKIEATSTVPEETAVTYYAQWKPVITFGAAEVDAGKVDVAMTDYSLDASVGGGGTISFALKDGESLPEGLSLSDGKITGTPTKAYDGKQVTIVASSTGADNVEATITVKVEKGDNPMTIADSATVKVGATTTLNPSNNKGTVTYASSDPGVATVSDAGVVTGVKAGAATITVTDPGNDDYVGGSKTVTVTVSELDPSTAPTITTQPTNATATVGGTATFTVTATGTTLTYQWQVKKTENGDFEDISGATGASYTIDATTLDMSGYQYLCVVTNTETGKAPTSVNSDGVTLTVTKPALSGTVSITGTPKVGETLTADGTSLSGADQLGDITYKWYYSDDSATPLGTGETYTPTVSDLGKTLMVVAEAANCSGTVQAKAASAVVAGTPKVTLSVSAGNKTLTPKWTVDSMGATITDYTLTISPVEVTETSDESGNVTATTEVEVAGATNTSLTKDADGGNYTLTATLASDAASAAITGLTNGTTYTITVTANAATGNSETATATKKPSAGGGSTSTTEPEPEPKPEPEPEPSQKLLDVVCVDPFIKGDPDGKFRPEDPITRAEIAAIVSRILTEKFDDTKDYGADFSDVKPSAWYYNAVGFMQSLGLMVGDGDGSFRPNDYITRNEIAVLMAKVDELELDAGAEVSFKDAETVASWAASSVAAMAENNYINGYPDGTYRGESNITRAETATLVIRMIDPMNVSSVTKLPTDMTSAHWAYSNVVKGMNNRALLG